MAWHMAQQTSVIRFLPCGVGDAAMRVLHAVDMALSEMHFD